MEDYPLRCPATGSTLPRHSGHRGLPIVLTQRQNGRADWMDETVMDGQIQESSWWSWAARCLLIIIMKSLIERAMCAMPFATTLPPSTTRSRGEINLSPHVSIAVKVHEPAQVALDLVEWAFEAGAQTVQLLARTPDGQPGALTLGQVDRRLLPTPTSWDLVVNWRGKELVVRLLRPARATFRRATHYSEGAWFTARL